MSLVVSGFQQSHLPHQVRTVAVQAKDASTSGPPQGIKRRRTTQITEDNSFESFFILPYPHSHLDKPIAVWPHLLLTRGRVPLFFLDHRPAAVAGRSTRLITANISQLEHRHTGSLDENPQVLVVKLESDSSLFVIERVQKGVYSICRLAQAISVDVLKAQQISVSATPLENNVWHEKAPQNASWWNEAVVPGCKPVEEALSAAGSLYKTPTNVDTSSPTLKPPTESTTIPIPEATALDALDNQGPPQSLEDVYITIVKQYFDALYGSKASLAYFAKGPLSRARAARGQNQEQLGDQPALHEFLRQLILDTSLLEKKHKITLPSMLKQCGSTTIGPVKSKKRKSGRKLKPDKDGLLPGENEALSSWWTAEDFSTTTSADTAETYMKTRVGYIRVRENLLQLILVLEVLALESLLSDTLQNKGSESQITQEQAQIDVDTQSLVRRKSRKPKNLDEVVDTLIDRLTIWQSIESIDSMTEHHDTTEDADASVADTASAAQSLKSSSDQLKDFAADVVVPFYTARLPHIVQKLARRLGVSTGRSPPKRREQKPRRASPAPLPGARLQVRGQDPRKPLPRADSDSFKRPTPRAPSLMRSATDSMVDDANRERSSTPRLSFNAAREKRSLSRASSINYAKDLSQREMDFGVIAKFNEAKSRKKVSVEQELQDAIATLKKPNRGLAVKEFADASDSRKLPVFGRSRGTNNNSRPSLAGPQIKATPKRLNKTKDMVSTTPARAGEEESDMPEQIVTSSCPCIPSSTMRPQSIMDSASRRSNPVFETPSKLRTMSENAATATGKPTKEQTQPEMFPILSPDIPRPPVSVFKFPAMKVSSGWTNNHFAATGLAQPVFETPVNQRLSTGRVASLSPSGADVPRKFSVHAVTAVNQAQVAPSQIEQGNIYDSLGWDDLGDD